ncbi:hypothetical protein [Pseudarthrobacter scleromae]|uniref:Type II toxin-antitoxin system HicA family toxin n=1 Tax=Pseudarthrobacter scleromae TaxID=158897 RepID=A0ABQ2CFL8_9MICC|nr:hypothetical protein [Pseudarthrobacter scleromae]GGI86707.1 hypothetical protein GCM10007175_24880 [Pseudarthrobacter scleromae]
MKRIDLIREAKRIAKEPGETWELTNGGRHDLGRVGNGIKVAIPRHNEINEITAQKILKHLKN